MLFSLSLIILFGLLANYLFAKINIPGLIGMLLVGILCGPHFFNLIDQNLLNISYDLRMMAFIILLLHASLTLNKQTVIEVGKIALPLGFLPALFEMIGIFFLAIFFLKSSPREAVLLGVILSAVSPAVVVTMMLKFAGGKQKTKRNLPTLMITATSLDNVFIITLFSVCISFYFSETASYFLKILNIPLSIIFGILTGGVFGIVLVKIFKRFKIRATKKMLIVLGAALLLVHIENLLKTKLPFSSVLAVLSIGFVLLETSEEIAHQVSKKLSKLWIFAELILFILVGASVNVAVAFEAGLLGLFVIFSGLIIRSLGVFLSLIRTKFSSEEKIFCIASYLPKATVQALLGSIPLSMGIEGGELILAMAVLAIIFTAPLGAFLIDKAGKKTLISQEIT